MDSPLAVVRDDRVRGARALSFRTLRRLARVSRDWASLSIPERRAHLRYLARALAECQPAMAVFRRWAAELALASVTASALRDPAWPTRWAGAELRALRAEPAGVRRTVRQEFPVGATVVTISRSTTVASALAALPVRQRPRFVLALASEPGGGGRELARMLRTKGIRSRTVDDRTADQVVRRADLVLVGADAIEPDGAVVHKVGTLRLARLAARHGVPVVVVAGTSKRLRTGPRQRTLPDRFDRTPRKLIFRYWTDAGVWPGGAQPRRRP